MLVGLPVEQPPRRYDAKPVWLLCLGANPRVREPIKFLVHRLPPDYPMLVRACLFVRVVRQ